MDISILDILVSISLLINGRTSDKVQDNNTGDNCRNINDNGQYNNMGNNCRNINADVDNGNIKNDLNIEYVRILSWADVVRQGIAGE